MTVILNRRGVSTFSVLCTLIYTDLSDCTSAHTIQFSQKNSGFTILVGTFVTWTTHTYVHKKLWQACSSSLVLKTY